MFDNRTAAQTHLRPASALLTPGLLTPGLLTLGGGLRHSPAVGCRAAEATVLSQVGAFLGGAPEIAAQAVIARLYDCIVLLQAGYYHPDQQGSYSIKKVAGPLLGHGYEDLDIQDGMAAVVAWRRALEPDITPDERERQRRALLAYCGRDTALMHEIIEKIRALVA